MQSLYPIKFNQEKHRYTLNGVVIPGVTTIISDVLFYDMYKGVSKEIIEKAKIRGKNVHEAIENEDDYNLNDPEEKKSYYKWLYLKNKFKINPIHNELIVYSKKYNYCGTLDMIAEIEGKYYLCDIKTTYQVHKEYLKYQLKMYHIALEESYPTIWHGDKIVKISGYFCISVNNSKMAKLIKIDIIEEKKIDIVVRAFNMN